MERVIQPGDTVRIIFSEVQLFTDFLMYTTEFVGEVIHTPSDVGDFWHFKILDKIVYLNPMNTAFKGLVLLKKAVEEDVPF